MVILKQGQEVKLAEEKIFDIGIIGGGPAGYCGAIYSARLGAKVVVFEKQELGGVCLNKGCIPTKALVASAHLVEKMRKAREFGLDFSSDIKPDFRKALERKDKVVSVLKKGIKTLFKANRISLEEGTARLIEPQLVELTRADGSIARMRAKHIVIATGSSPSSLAGIELDGEYVLSSDHILELNNLPKSILIVGAGAIGCEWAFILNSFGVEVSIVEILERALPMEDEEISEILEREFRKRGIRFFKQDRIKSLKKADGKVFACTEKGLELEAEKLVLSVGRKPNTEGLGLEELGIELDSKGFIKVNLRMETTVKGVYSAGDVIGPPLFAHTASYGARVAVTNALGGNEEMDYRVIPSTTFTFPEVGSVGLREKDAREMGIKYKTAVFPIRALGKAHAIGDIEGIVKLIVSADSEELIGAHIISANASELIHELALAMKFRLKAKELGNLIHSHPTLSEAIMECALLLEGKGIHSL